MKRDDVEKNSLGFCCTQILVCFLISVFTLTSMAYGLLYAVTKKLLAQQSHLAKSLWQRAATCS